MIRWTVRKHDNKTWDPHFCLSPGCGLWPGIQYSVRTLSLLHGSLCDWDWGPATKTLGAWAFRKMGEEKERAMHFDPWRPTLFWSAWIMHLTPSVWLQGCLALLALSLSPGSVFCLCPTSLDQCLKKPFIRNSSKRSILWCLSFEKCCMLFSPSGDSQWTSAVVIKTVLFCFVLFC